MFRIRRIHDDLLDIDKRAIAQISSILETNFPEIEDRALGYVTRSLKSPFIDGFMKMSFIAENGKGDVIGWVLCSYHKEINFVYLDYLVAKQKGKRGGVGGALYQRVREKAASLGAHCVFLECEAILPEIYSPEEIKVNKSRFKFYEKFGAFPVENTNFELTRKNGLAYSLVYDDLGSGKALTRKYAKKVLDPILGTINAKYCSQSYLDQVVKSFKDDPVVLSKSELDPQQPVNLKRNLPDDERIILVASDIHGSHKVQDKDYEETPVRIEAIQKGLDKVDVFKQVKPKKFPQKHITEVHDKEYFDFLKTFCTSLDPGHFIYPEVFPPRHRCKLPRELIFRAGYYCTDNFTPLSRDAYLSAVRAVDCAMTAADEVIKGARFAYALVRPPGHHAEKKFFGGFCFLNSTAIVANYLSKKAKVAILDIDYHHGNGQQDIFYDRDDVYTVSIHANPRDDYPYYSGFADEVGEGKGLEFNLNIPLPVSITSADYNAALIKALDKIKKFQPSFLVLALGFDTAKGDPTGKWPLSTSNFKQIGSLLGECALPTVIIQEGGYRTASLGNNARSFFEGLWDRAFNSKS